MVGKSADTLAHIKAVDQTMQGIIVFFSVTHS